MCSFCIACAALSLTNFTSPPVQSPGAAPTSGESSDVAVANAKAKKRRLYIILGECWLKYAILISLDVLTPVPGRKFGKALIGRVRG